MAPRRWRGSEPPWGQAAANTNQPRFVAPLGQRRKRYLWAKRGRPVEPPWPQATAAPPPAWVPQTPPHRLLWALLSIRRSRHIEPPWFQAAPNTNQPVFVAGISQRRRPWPWLRRGRVTGLPTSMQEQPPYGDPRVRTLPWVRRPRPLSLPFVQTTPINPAFVEWVRHRALQRFWSKPPKGRPTQPPWGQATPAPNPKFTDFIRRRLQRWFTKPPKGRPFEPPWGQAVVYADTVTIFDYLFDITGRPLPNRLVTVRLNISSGERITPLRPVLPISIQTMTDANGYWELTVIPNPQIQPDSFYTVEIAGLQGYQVLVPNVDGPFQTTSIMST